MGTGLPILGISSCFYSRYEPLGSGCERSPDCSSVNQIPIEIEVRLFYKERRYILGENSVRLSIAAILMLMLSSAALAVPETHQLGPYTVSFNMNTDMGYQTQTQDPAVYPFAAIYPLVIKTDNATGASISITQYNNLTPSILGVNEEIAALRMALRGINVTAPEEMVIDNMNGFLLSGMPFAGMGNASSGFMFYQAQYWLDSRDCECGPVSVGTVLVNIASTYPRNVTENLLSSIHVAAGQVPHTQAQDQNISITPSSNNAPEETFGFVEGRVYNQKNDVGVASAEITVDYNPTRIMTDALGNYRVKVLPAQHRIGAQSSNYSVIPSSVTVYRNQTTKLDLKAISR
jgi:hypothetical protein